MASDLTLLSASIDTTPKWTVQQDVDGSDDPLIWSSQDPQTFSLGFGDGDGQADALLFTQEVLPAGGGEGEIDLFALTTPQSNFNLSFGFATVKMILIWVVENIAGEGVGSSAVAIGNALVSPFAGWLSPGATAEISFGSLPYQAGDLDGKPVTSLARYLKLQNNDPDVNATVNVLVVGVKKT